MPAYVYRVRDLGGGLQQGRVEGDSEQEIVRKLRGQGYLILAVEKDRDLGTMMQSTNSFFSRRVTGKDLAVFARQFATMINAGLPVVTALKVLSRQEHNARLRQALATIAVDVEAGETLANAFARHKSIFPTIMLQMINAGEVGGILDDVCVRVAEQLEKEENIRQKVKSAMVYPSLVSVLAVAVVLFLMIFVVPRFTEVYNDLGAELPGLTKGLIGFSNTLARYWWLFGSIIGISVFAVLQWFKTDVGAIARDRSLIKLPVFGMLVVKQSIARFARTLSSLLGSGITILNALTVVERTVGNRVVAAAIRDAAEDVRQGQTLVTPLKKSGVFPPMVVEMVSVGEETGTLEEMLGKIADFYEADVERMAERLSATMEPMIIVFLAITVGVIVIAMMLPIFNLWSILS